LHYKLPIALSAHVQATDHGSLDSVAGGTKVLPDGRTVAAERVLVNGYP